MYVCIVFQTPEDNPENGPEYTYHDPNLVVTKVLIHLQCSNVSVHAFSFFIYLNYAYPPRLVFAISVYDNVL